jgi:acyl-ACP thioesterase
MPRNRAVWEEPHTIHSYEVDVGGRVLPHVLFSYMLNSAWNHVFHTEFNYESLAMEGQFWALARFLMYVTAWPRWNEKVTVATWGKDIDRLFAVRDFCIRSGDGRSGSGRSESGAQLVAATSSWLILDGKTMRPQKMDRLREYFPFNHGVHALDVKLGKIVSPETRKHTSGIRVRYTDVDVNRHVNAARYLQWILDSYGFDGMKKRDLESCQLNFIGEAKPEDEVAIHADIRGATDYVSVVRVSDCRELCRSALQWRMSNGF